MFEPPAINLWSYSLLTHPGRQWVRVPARVGGLGERLLEPLPPQALADEHHLAAPHLCARGTDRGTLDPNPGPYHHPTSYIILLHGQ